MNLRRLIQDNWKGAVVGLAVGAAALYGGPIAGKAVRFIVPKALEHVKDAPITAIKAHENPFSKEKVTRVPVEVVLRITPDQATALRRAVPEWTPTGKMFCRIDPP